MALRAAPRWWAWSIGKPSVARVRRKWLSEEASETLPLMAAVATGLTMGVATIAYQLLYNPSILCARAWRRGSLQRLRAMCRRGFVARGTAC